MNTDLRVNSLYGVHIALVTTTKYCTVVWCGYTSSIRVPLHTNATAVEFVNKGGLE